MREPSAGRAPGGEGSSAILTVPNVLSFARILLIPAFGWLIVHRGTEALGIVLFGLVSATDWVDGWIARRTGRVSELGKVLDPIADRLAIGGGLLALVLRGAFPAWAAVLVAARDAVLLVAGAVLLVRWGVRIEIRWLGKVATFTLMLAIPAIAWGALGLPLAAAATALGWTGFVVGVVESYAAAVLYARDVRLALADGGAVA
ncbi:MAG TPA: CDP-alcohol phosphatidyltransferase family protein [Actinomycetota bacterium]|nr:CDP-alcohol phosphatidyltransferase family protein [Actinomycetota bacterium]